MAQSPPPVDSDLGFISSEKTIVFPTRSLVHFLDDRRTRFSRFMNPSVL
jgi:hypothetical protein